MPQQPAVSSRILDGSPEGQDISAYPWTDWHFEEDSLTTVHADTADVAEDTLNTFGGSDKLVEDELEAVRADVESLTQVLGGLRNVTPKPRRGC